MSRSSAKRATPRRRSAGRRHHARCRPHRPETGPDGDGVDITKALRHPASGPAVVILTTYDHDVDIVRAAEAGAAGYLLKDADPQAIIAAIRTAAAGGIVLDESQERRVGVDEGAPRRPVRARARGAGSRRRRPPNREIAKALFLSEATVKTHLVHAFDKTRRRLPAPPPWLLPAPPASSTEPRPAQGPAAPARSRCWPPVWRSSDGRLPVAATGMPSRWMSMGVHVWPRRRARGLRQPSWQDVRLNRDGQDAGVRAGCGCCTR